MMMNSNAGERLISDHERSLSVPFVRGSLFLETVVSILSLAEKVLAISYCHQKVSVIALYGVQVVSAVLKFASSSIKNALLKSAIKIVIESLQVMLYLALLGYSLGKSDPVAVVFIVIASVQLVLAPWIIFIEDSRKKRKEKIILENPVIFAHYNDWYSEAELLTIKRELFASKVQRMLAPMCLPIMITYFFSDASPIKSATFYLMTTIYMWALEEYAKTQAAEQVYLFDEAGSSYESQRLFGELKKLKLKEDETFVDRYGEDLDEYLYPEYEPSYTWYVFYFRLMLVYMLCWFMAMGVLLMEYCPTLPKNDHDYAVCIVFTIPFCGMYAFAGIMLVFYIIPDFLQWCCSTGDTGGGAAEAYSPLASGATV